jgi:hypothetical protein
MKKPSPAVPSRWCRWTAPVAPLLLVFTLTLAGCVTRQQVADLVTQSNAVMLAGAGVLPEPNAQGTPPAWQTESARLDAFIAAHPSQPATTAPLRLRQALLLLAHGQFHLAAAAFNAVQLEDLHTARDQALKRQEPTLLWWFASSTKANWEDADWTQARASLRTLREEQTRLADEPAIRDYLAELRAWIGLTAARQTSSGAKALFEDALDVYAETFTAADLASLLAVQEQLPDPQALGPDVRRRLRAKAVIAHAQRQNREDDLGAQPANPTFAELLNRP